MNWSEASTAAEVLAGRDLRRKRVLVTGASSGVGVELVRVLAGHGADVVGTARDLEKASVALRAAGCDTAVKLIALDLASLASVRACGDALASHEPFDVIVANAGVMAVAFHRTEDGFETHFATNYLGHFLLVNRLARSLRRGARVVMISSAGHRGADVDLDDPGFRQTPYDPLVAYRRSKTAMILFAVAFDRRHRGRDVRAVAVHPGAVLTETTRRMIEAQPEAALAFTWKTVEQGAATPLWAAFVAPPDRIGGRYGEDCHVARVDDDPASRSGVRGYALDPERAEALWVQSAMMVGERF